MVSESLSFVESAVQETFEGVQAQQKGRDWVRGVKEDLLGEWGFAVDGDFWQHGDLGPDLAHVLLGFYFCKVNYIFLSGLICNFYF